MSHRSSETAQRQHNYFWFLTVHHDISYVHLYSSSFYDHGHEATTFILSLDE